MRILTLQSSVTYGHVGNSAATFPLQRLGHDVWPVPTVQFSNHTGYADWSGPVLAPEEVRAIVDGVARRGVLPGCDAILSGYLGDVATGKIVRETVDRVREANPLATYCCDPVLGDADRGAYVRPGIAEFVRDELVPQADVVTPNQFELDALTGRTTTTLAEVAAAIDELRKRGPRHVLVTSVLPHDGALDIVASSPEGTWAVTTPLLPVPTAGAGDLTAALYLAHLTSDGSPATALAATVSSVYAVLEHTMRTGAGELAIVAAQDAIADPPMNFLVRQLHG